MRFDLFIDGKIHKVEVGLGKVIAVDVEGKKFQVEVNKNKEEISVLVDKKKYPVRFGEKYVTIGEQKHNIWIRNLRRGMPNWNNVTEESEESKIKTLSHKMSSGEEIIRPPMPGRVISIKVKKGDKVKIGTSLMVLEAMKMQNEIHANTNGFIREIKVLEGDLVESSDVLIIIGS